MELVRLKGLVAGTAKSKQLKEGEQDTFIIPTWVSCPDKGLESINDYVNRLILDTPEETGDLILDAFIQSTQVPEDMDTSSNNPAMRPYLLDESCEVQWTEEQNIFVTVIEGIMSEKDISFVGDVGDTAYRIYQAVSGTPMLGWSNLDPSDAIEIIGMVLTAMYEEEGE